ncbi:MAG TPA: hypothetical protein VGP96_09175, partial [Candidatus Dormibacteraeota bacterium]|nr:hypothetical protein [Candidatus Dormibacteraeota bacterium]
MLAPQIAPGAVGDSDSFCRRVEMPGSTAAGGELGRSAAGGDARPICRRWGCSADLPPVEKPGAAAGGEARLFCGR